MIGISAKLRIGALMPKLFGVHKLLKLLKLLKLFLQEESPELFDTIMELSRAFGV